MSDEECPRCGFIIDDGSGYCPICSEYISMEHENNDYLNEIMERDD